MTMILTVFLRFILLFAFCKGQNPIKSEIDEAENELWEEKRSFHKSNTFGKGWLFGKEGNTDTEYHTYDGWYNNPWNPSLGSTLTPLIRLLPAAYDGGIYKPVNRSRANPFVISDQIMKDVKCNGYNGSSRTGKNVFMVFFGQFVVEEIMDARVSSCPPNYFNIPIPKKHIFKNAGVSDMPFIRTNYDKKSGISPNNPRKQLNSATAWIDGSVIYGKTKSHAEVLRAFKHGLLKSDTTNSFPADNDDFLSVFSPSRNYIDNKINRKNFRVGNRLAHENPFILTMNIIFHRWHNYLATSLGHIHKDWDDDKLFYEARKWVIATLQNIIVNEWLPAFLDDELPRYFRYDPSIDPSISNAFQSAAMRFGHTLVPPAVYVSKKIGDDIEKPSSIQLCNSFYDAQDFIYYHSVDSMILGMILQAAELEDTSVVDDLRNYLHGPPEFTRRDLMAINIQRGRDHGLPSYGHARKMLFPFESEDDYSFEKLTPDKNIF